jgi:hypothetical protein
MTPPSQLLVIILMMVLLLLGGGGGAGGGGGRQLVHAESSKESLQDLDMASRMKSNIQQALAVEQSSDESSEQQEKKSLRGGETSQCKHEWQQCENNYHCCSKKCLYHLWLSHENRYIWQCLPAWATGI